MAETLSMALAELLRKADADPDIDRLSEGVRVMNVGTDGAGGGPAPECGALGARARRSGCTIRVGIRDDLGRAIGRLGRVALRRQVGYGE